MQLAIVNRRGKRRRARNAHGRFVKVHRAHRSRRTRRRRRSVARRSHRRAVARNPRRYMHRVRRSHHRARRRRNPRFSLSSGRQITGKVMSGLVGAGGAIALEILMNKATPHLPASLQSGWGNTGIKLVAALGLGWGASKLRIVGRENAQLIALGGLIVVLANAIRGVVAQNFPQAGLSAYMNDYTAYPIGVGYVDPAPRLGAYMSQPGQMSAYMNRGGVDTVGTYDGGDGM